MNRMTFLRVTATNFECSLSASFSITRNLYTGYLTWPNLHHVLLYTSHRGDNGAENWAQEYVVQEITFSNVGNMKIREYWLYTVTSLPRLSRRRYYGNQVNLPKWHFHHLTLHFKNLVYKIKKEVLGLRFKTLQKSALTHSILLLVHNLHDSKHIYWARKCKLGSARTDGLVHKVLTVQCFSNICYCFLGPSLPSYFS